MEQLATASRCLTQSQFAFAQRTGAHPGLTSHRGAVFFYREDEDGTRRWLVDEEGHVLDFVEFPKGGRELRVGVGATVEETPKCPLCGQCLAAGRSTVALDVSRGEPAIPHEPGPESGSVFVHASCASCVTRVELAHLRAAVA